MTKLKTISDALAGLTDGMTIMVGGFLATGCPDALVDEIVRRGAVSEDELRRVFNLGIGMVIATPKPDEVIAAARSVGVEASVIGEVAPAEGDVRVRFDSDR